MDAELMVDAAFPPGPQQWVADMDAIGAQAGAVYAWGPYTNYTYQHVTYAQSRGRQVLPIVVPGNGSPLYSDILAALHSLGFYSGPLAFDFELGSEPALAWWRSAVSYFTTVGFLVDRYGTVSTLGQYDPGAGDWIADWIRTGVLNPVPVLPAGWNAWQFVNDVVVNGNQYDVSVVDSSFLGGNVRLEADDPIVADLVHAIHGAYWLAATGGAVDGDPNGNPPPEHHRLDYGSMIAGIAAKIDALAQPQADPVAIATALASHPLTVALSDTERDDIASHVLKHLSASTAAG